MALNIKEQVASVLIVAVMFALYSANGVSCQGGESSAADKLGAIANNKSPLGAAGLPMIVVRQSGSSGGAGSGNSGKPDIYLGWLNWDGMSFMKPLMGSFAQQITPFSQQMSGMLLDTIPGASSMYQQLDQMGNQFSQLNPMSQLMGQLGGSSGSSSGSGSNSGLGSFFGGRR